SSKGRPISGTDALLTLAENTYALIEIDYSECREGFANKKWLDSPLWGRDAVILGSIPNHHFDCVGHEANGRRIVAVGLLVPLVELVDGPDLVRASGRQRRRINQRLQAVTVANRLPRRIPVDAFAEALAHRNAIELGIHQPSISKRIGAWLDAGGSSRLQ